MGEGRAHIPKNKMRRGRKYEQSSREILNAIFYVLRSDCAWRMLPHDFPKWKTVYYYFRLWRRNGTWERMNTALRTELRILDGRELEPSAAILDSQSIKTTETPGMRGDDTGKRIKGCTACYRCLDNKDRKCAVKNDTVNDYIEKMVEADGIILESPTYFADITPEMKALIDRSGLTALANGFSLPQFIIYFKYK